MTGNDLNQIDELLKRRLGESENKVMAEVGKFIEDEILTVLDSHTTTLNSHTTALKQIITNTENNKDNVGKLNKRVINLENQAGIVPLPELTMVS